MAKYDVFLSYRNEDKDAVEYIAQRLRNEHKLKVWLDKWNLIPGQPWQEELEEALNNSKAVAVFVGSSGVGSWENEEMRVALAARVSKKELSVIPVILPGTPPKESIDLPGFLSRLTWVDLRVGLDNETQIHNLICGIKGVPPGDNFPTEQSIFPLSLELPKPGSLPPGSRVPFPHNAIFTGRQEELKTLAKVLIYDPQEIDMPVRQAITCTVGIGKTQLAVEFCHHYGRYFRGVHWINARLDINAEIAACGAEMELPYWPATTPEQVQVTLRTWQQTNPRLLVLDHVEDPQLIREWLSRLGGCRILLTTRRHNWPPDLGVETYPLDFLPLSESLALVRKLAPRLRTTPDTELKTIVQHLGNLPLALYLAGRYLHERPTLSPLGYLEELSDTGLLSNPAFVGWVESGLPTDQDTNLRATFLLIWQQLDNRKPVDNAAINIFRACGYLAPNTPIPRKIFSHLERNKPQIDHALKRLQNLGLLTEDLVIHHLLAEFARIQDNDKASLEALADILAETSYDANSTSLPTEFTPLRPHVEIVARFASENQLDKADQLWGNLGTHLRIVAEFDKAIEANQEALSIATRLFGPNHTKIALRRNNLGRVLHVIGDLGNAKKHYEAALSIDEKNFGPDDPIVALRCSLLGMILKDLRDLENARKYIERAQAIDEKVFDSDHPNVARDINYLGWILKDQGKLEEALDVFEHALSISEEYYGTNHPDVVRDMTGKGWTLKEHGKLDDALDTFERARAIDEELFGLMHPDVARESNSIGCVLRDQKKFQDAQEAFKEAMAIYERAYKNPNHPEIANVIINLGLVFHTLGKLGDARQCFERARAIDEKVFGPGHPNVARDIWCLGWVLKDQGKPEEALDAFEFARAIDEKYHGTNHPDVARDISSIGWGLKELGKLNEALDAFERARAIDEKAYGISHPAVAKDVDSIGCVLKDQGKLHDAQETFRVALDIFEKAYKNPNHLEIANVVTNLGTVLQGLGELEDAKRLYERALSIYEVIPPANPTYIPTIRENLRAIEGQMYLGSSH